MGKYALINNDLVVNVVAWDGSSEVDFGEGIVSKEIPDDVSVSIGYSFKDGEFRPPALTDEEQSAQDAQEITANLNRKESLIAEVNSTISVWQTKLLVGRKLTDAETKSLNQWLDYYDLLVSVDANTKGSIKWPQKPI